MRGMFRRWRLRVWSDRLRARELHLEAFKKSPFSTFDRRTEQVEGDLKNRVAKATYKASVITALLRSPLPRALTISERDCTG